jgi:hypothetical protein
MRVLNMTPRNMVAAQGKVNGVTGLCLLSFPFSGITGLRRAAPTIAFPSQTILQSIHSQHRFCDLSSIFIGALCRQFQQMRRNAA